MRLFLLAALVMLAFAANSLLNRMALAGDQIGALEFAAIRLGSGAVALAVLVLLRGRGLAGLWQGGPVGVVALALYVLGFSMAYLALDAGVGALILFAGVQITMFAGAVITGERVPLARWFGSVFALAGLAWLLWPSGAAVPSIMHGGLMAAAALGWGVYSLIGKRSTDPLAATASNFLFATPIAIGLMLVAPPGEATITPSTLGVILAILSGVVTSGLGYALWYAILPRLASSVAALAQLTVPVIAVIGGAVLLHEPVSLRLVMACLLVIGGVGFGVLAPQRRIASSGS